MSQMTTLGLTVTALQNIYVTDDHIHVPFVLITTRPSFPIYDISPDFYISNRTGDTSAAVTALPPGAPDFAPFLAGFTIAQSLVLCVVSRWYLLTFLGLEMTMATSV